MPNQVPGPESQIIVEGVPMAAGSKKISEPGKAVSSTGPRIAGAGPLKGPQVDSASVLLAFESDVRTLTRESELFAHWCNSTRPFLSYRQAFLFRCVVHGDSPHLEAATSLPAVDRDAPFVRWLEHVVNGMRSDLDASKPQSFQFTAYSDPGDEEFASYPFTECVWTPLIEDGVCIGGFLTVRESPWTQNEQLLTQRFCATYVHSWQAIRGQGKLARKPRMTNKRYLVLGLILCLLACFPVSITALAPVEVAPLDPTVVAAPFNGVVKEILVDQGALVNVGDALIAFEDVEWRNEYEIADEHEAVARARYERESQRAIGDSRAKREIAVAKAELALATTEKRYARELLSKTSLLAESSGLAVYTDKRDWVGKPVSAGESILQIADPQKVRFALDLPVRESLVLKRGARIKVFLDSDPLHPLEATLVEANYQATQDKRNILSYQLSGDPVDSDQPLPRIGVQGTAQIYGADAPLIYVLLRKPIASLRQFTGW